MPRCVVSVAKPYAWMYLNSGYGMSNDLEGVAIREIYIWTKATELGWPGWAGAGLGFSDIV